MKRRPLCLNISLVEIGAAEIIMHELGHNMGQAYANKSIDAKAGRPQTIKVIKPMRRLMKEHVSCSVLRILR